MGEMDTCFAMARGYQGEAGDVRALPMRKWFNTNYHYMVPLLDDPGQIRLQSDKPLRHYREAAALGIETRPVLIGPFTFLTLAECRGDKGDYTAPVVAAYAELLGKLGALGATWVQMDEPILVTDLTQDDQALFAALYEPLLAVKARPKMLLQTYFGDIRDAYAQAAGMGFDGIGLDFVEGKQSLALVKAHGFPQDALLFAGVVNGKNVWRNDYAGTLALLGELAEYADVGRIVFSTSCSLLHVPYTVESETAMDERYKRHLAFAYEKLGELADLKRLSGCANCASDEAYIHNTLLIREQAAGTDAGCARVCGGADGGGFCTEARVCGARTAAAHGAGAAAAAHHDDRFVPADCGGEGAARGV